MRTPHRDECRLKEQLWVLWTIVFISAGVLLIPSLWHLVSWLTSGGREKGSDFSQRQGFHISAHFLGKGEGLGLLSPPLTSPTLPTAHPMSASQFPSPLMPTNLFLLFLFSSYHSLPLNPLMMFPKSSPKPLLSYFLTAPLQLFLFYHPPTSTSLAFIHLTHLHQVSSLFQPTKIRIRICDERLLLERLCSKNLLTKWACDLLFFDRVQFHCLGNMITLS